MSKEKATAYWGKNLRVVAWLLAIWFLVSYVFGIMIAPQLDQFRIAGFPLGFYFAQQGSMYIFVILIFVYCWIMNRAEREHDVHED